jgi:protein-S-isoprenylcysteine O-methyltransferase Ste14
VPWWHWINWLALDAVVVAVAWLWMFAGMTGARLTAVNSLVVGAAVVLHFVTTLAAWWQPPTHPTYPRPTPPSPAPSPESKFL